MEAHLPQVTWTNGVITNSTMHSLLYWQGDSLVRQELFSLNGTPKASQLSTLKRGDTCGTVMRALDFAVPDRSWHIFAKRQADNSCPQNDAVHVAVRHDAGTKGEPRVVPQPLVHIVGNDGALTGFLSTAAWNTTRTPAMSPPSQATSTRGKTRS